MNVPFNVAWLTWALLILGLAGLAAGLRGRAVGRVPECRQCGYRLFNMMATPSSRCPECGHDVWLGTVVHRLRERNRRLIKWSWIMLALAFVSLSIQLLIQFAVLDWQRFRDVESLKNDIAQTQIGEDREAAWRELGRRRSTGQLSAESLGDIAATALDRHLQMLRTAESRQPRGLRRLADLLAQPAVSTPLAEHARWVQAAWSDRLIHPEHIRAYVQTMFQPTVEIDVREHAIAGLVMPVGFYLHGAGCGGFDAVEVAVSIIRVTVDGRENTIDADGWQPLVQLLSADRDGPIQGSHGAIILQAPPGRHTLIVEVRCGLTSMTIGSGPAAATIGRPAPDVEVWPITLYEWTERFQSQVQIGESRK